jgi:hypothetical protein
VPGFSFRRESISNVMPGIIPGIHALRRHEDGMKKKPWMAGSSPAMTRRSATTITRHPGGGRGPDRSAPSPFVSARSLKAPRMNLDSGLRRNDGDAALPPPEIASRFRPPLQGEVGFPLSRGRAEEAEAAEEESAGVAGRSLLSLGERGRTGAGRGPQKNCPASRNGRGASAQAG